MMLSDICLSYVCRVHPVGGRRVRPAGCMVHIGWSGPARPAWLKAAAARFRCRPWRERIVAAYSLFILPYHMLCLCSLHRVLSLAAQCIVIGPVCGFATGGRAGGRCLLPR